MRHSDKNVLQMWKIARPKRRRRASAPPKRYTRKTMPIVDAHMHLHVRRLKEGQTIAQGAKQYLKIMDKAGIDVTVNLSGSPDVIEQVDDIHAKTSGRVLTCPGTYFKKDAQDLWWSKRDLDSFVHENIAGLKIWCKYHQPLRRKSVDEKIGYQAQVGLPAIGMHIADPPVRGFWSPNFWDCIRDAEQTIRDHPEVNFIMAHGFWLMTEDEGLGVLGTYFDAYPNLYVDLSAVYQWWDGPEPTYDKLRDFIIRYKDRILYGTDGHQAYTTPERFARSFAVLESRKRGLTGFFGEPGKPTQIHGLGLPIEVLHYLYFWNAARLIPAVRTSLRGLGYEV